MTFNTIQVKMCRHFFINFDFGLKNSYGPKFCGVSWLSGLAGLKLHGDSEGHAP